MRNHAMRRIGYASLREIWHGWGGGALSICYGDWRHRGGRAELSSTRRGAYRKAEEQHMKSIEILVPAEIVSLLGSEDAVRKEAREAFIFDLVRRGKVSKGKAAELLGIS